MRDVVDGIRYLTHNGPVWRALRADFPPAWTLYYWAAKWQADGSTETMHGQLRDRVRELAGARAHPRRRSSIAVGPSRAVLRDQPELCGGRSDPVVSRLVATLAAEGPRALSDRRSRAGRERAWALAGRRSGADERPGVEVASVLGRALLAMGQEERAIALFEDAVARGTAHGRPAVVAIGLLNLGYLSLVHGDLSQAREELERSVEAAVECGDGHAHARALAGLASVALEDGHDEEALALAARSLDVSGPAFDRDTICWALELAGVACAAIAPSARHSCSAPRRHCASISANSSVVSS